jgi:hypothetical protein
VTSDNCQIKCLYTEHVNSDVLSTVRFVIVWRDEAAHFIPESAVKCFGPCGVVVTSRPGTDPANFSDDIFKCCVRQASRRASVSVYILCVCVCVFVCVMRCVEVCDSQLKAADLQMLGPQQTFWNRLIGCELPKHIPKPSVAVLPGWLTSVFPRGATDAPTW